MKNYKTILRAMLGMLMIVALAANIDLQKSEDRVDTSDISIRDMGGLPEMQ